jgi:nucleoside-diphosphate-sugar epimerase
VVLGADRPLGRVLVDALLSESREVRGVYLERRAVDQGSIRGAQTVLIDPAEAFNVTEACQGAQVIYDCYEPNYSAWKQVWPQVTSNAVLAAIEVGAPFVFASHLLNSESENERQEAEVLRAHNSKLISTAVVRLPQLIGYRVINPLWKLIYDSVLAGKKAHWIGDPDVPRSLLDVEDAARAMIQLAESPRLFGRTWSVASPESITGRQFIELAFKAVGRKPDVGRWGRGIVLTGGLLASDAREVLKMPYDYYTAFELNGKDFADALSSFHFVPFESSVSKGIQWYRALGSEAAK